MSDSDQAEWMIQLRKSSQTPRQLSLAPRWIRDPTSDDQGFGFQFMTTVIGSVTSLSVSMRKRLAVGRRHVVSRADD